MYASHMKLTEGLLPFMEHLHANNIPRAVASNAPVENIHFVVDNLQLRPYFKVLLHVDSVANPKPAPDMFLKAAAVLTTHTREEFDRPDLFIQDFVEVSSAMLELQHC